MIDEKKPREFDLKHADEVLKEYSEPHSMIDNGNLFFAATEYQGAYEALEQKLAIKESAMRCQMCGNIGMNHHGLVMTDEINELKDKLTVSQKWTAELEKLRREEQLMRHEAQDENKRLKEKLELLRRYHWGDGTITRETVIEVLKNEI